MTTLPFRITLCAILLAVVPARASIKGNEASQKLVDEGSALYGQGKPQQAWDAFERAHKADPGASEPVSMLANMLFTAARNAPADQVAGLRKQAELHAREALRIDGQDPVAQEILRDLMDDGATPLHAASPEAAKAIEEGEALFMQRRYPEALAKYELAAARDPMLSSAWVYAGDCFYTRQLWHEAELRFRKATEVEPLNGQAWRFLSDALAMQGQHEAAQAALFGGIAASPGQLPTWSKLESLMRHDGTPLKRLDLVRKVAGRSDSATGKIILDMTGSEKQGSVDSTTWLTLGMIEGSLKQAKDTPHSAFQIELQAWQTALRVASAMEKDGKGALADPGLVTLQRLAKAGQLETAILLLMYREAYRPEFEEWKRAHPDGIKAFIASYGLRP